MTLRFGIIGCGRIAGNHASALSSTADVDLVACCDVDTDRGRAFAAVHDIDHAVGSIDDLFDLGVDAVTVCTPHPAHEEAVVAAAHHQVHVLCEKPVSVDLDAADRMIAATDRAGIAFGVLFQRRFWPAARRIRDAIDDGTLGAPILGEVSVVLHRPSSYYAADAWRGRWDTDGGGVLMTQAVHQIDLLQWYLGPVESVSGFIRTHVHGDHIETEDSASAVVSFVSGATATITATTGANHNLGNRVSVVGAAGAVASLVEFPEGRAGVNDVWTVPGALELRPPFHTAVDANREVGAINADLADYHAVQVRDFVRAVETGTAPAVTGRDARASLAVVAAIYESSRTGRLVTPPPAPVPESIDAGAAVRPASTGETTSEAS